MNMKLNEERRDRCPPLVELFAQRYDAWIVGGAARYLLDLEENVKDWDLLVPLYRWIDAARVLPRGATANAFGGFKFQSHGHTLDVWGGDIGEHFSQNPYIPDYAIHLRTGTLLISGVLEGA